MQRVVTQVKKIFVRTMHPLATELAYATELLDEAFDKIETIQTQM